MVANNNHYPARVQGGWQNPAEFSFLREILFFFNLLQYYQASSSPSSSTYVVSSADRRVDSPHRLDFLHFFKFFVAEI